MQYFLGQRIEEELKKRGMTKAEFGRRIGTSRQNVNAILCRSALNTDLCLTVSKTLQHNFFLELAALIPDSHENRFDISTNSGQILAAFRCHPGITVSNALYLLNSRFNTEQSENHPLFLERVFVEL